MSSYKFFFIPPCKRLCVPSQIVNVDSIVMIKSIYFMHYVSNLFKYLILFLIFANNV